MPEKIDYKAAGVDVERGYKAVEQMREHVERTVIPGVLGGIGSFGGMFELPSGYKKPVLVSGTDGVGTKLQLAFMANKHDTIGIDAVAMCVNDIICGGAKPLFFLDYLGTGGIEPEFVAEIVKGVSDGCVQAGCALVGGETAEMPGFYKKDEYDIAGFAVGIVEKDKIIDGSKIKAGDVLIGIESSGLHSNGFSLVRKLLLEVADFSINDYSELLGKTYLEEVLTPTKIYVNTILNLIATFEISGISHITGGGFIENIPRILPDDTRVVVYRDTMPINPIFDILQDLGNLDNNDMYGTFNMGIGMVLAVDKDIATAVLAELNRTESAYLIGTVEERTTGEDVITIV